MRNSLTGGVILAALAIATPASADIVWGTGNQQYTNVNIVSATDVLSIVGDIGNTGYTMTFQNMIGPDLMTQVTMHGSHGDASIQSYADSQPGATATGFHSLTLVAQAGTYWTAGDLKLDLLNSSSPGTVTFNGFDSLGNALTPQSLSIDPNGQYPYNFVAINGEHITSITMDAVMLADLKQLSLNVGAVPEASTWAMMVLGFASVGFLAYRKRRLEQPFRLA